MRIKGKTQDGFNIGDIVSTLLQLPHIAVREGSRHELLLKWTDQPAYGIPGLCAVGRSTSYRRHILPWIKKATGYNADTVNYAMQQGSWQYAH
jgi:hypothetical protein